MSMDAEIKKEEKKRFFKYFRFWLIGAAVMFAIALVVNAGRYITSHRPRGNTQAPAERVYDYADVLTDAEEADLREYIAKLEKKAHVDLVLVTLNEPMGVDDDTWEWNMMNRADDFYDDNAYGWNKAYGDGALLLDNWYVDEETGSQKGSWLSTSGLLERAIGSYEEGRVFDRMDPYLSSSPYKAYWGALTELAKYGDNSSEMEAGEWASGVFGVVVISTITAVIYALVNLKQSAAKDTTVATTYVSGGKPVLNVKTDDFLRKSVTRQHIQSSSGGGSSGHSSSHSGGGSHGSHHSSSGHSHGGGGRRR